MVIFPKWLSGSLLPMFQLKSMYHMVISPKLSSATLVPMIQSKIGIIWSFSKINIFPPVPLFQAKNRYYMVIFPKLASIAHYDSKQWFSWDNDFTIYRPDGFATVKNRMRSLKQHIKYFSFRCKIQLTPDSFKARLRDFASWPPLAAGSSSRNLGPTL